LQSIGEMSLRVLLADDQPMVRAGLRMMLEAQGFDVVAEAENGHEAIALARTHRPDVCLIDIRMPGIDGLEVTRRLAGPENPDPTAVVVVTTFDLDDYVRTAIANGAKGFVLKDAGPRLVAEAVRAAANGDALISPSITTRLLHHFARTGDARSPTSPLTEREEDIVRLIAQGSSNQDIADALYISLSTVKSHVASVQLKLECRNRVQVAAWAWQTGRASPV
jgi:DNA-binding NarL/FixJ family response regulator